MIIDEPPPKPTLVEKLQTPQSVVTYRAVVGVLMAAVVSLVSYFGSSILARQDNLSVDLTKTRLDIAKTNGLLNEDNDRIADAESRLNQLADKSDLLDHRVTVIEARQGVK